MERKIRKYENPFVELIFIKNVRRRFNEGSLKKGKDVKIGKVVDERVFSVLSFRRFKTLEFILLRRLRLRRLRRRCRRRRLRHRCRRRRRQTAARDLLFSFLFQGSVFSILWDNHGVSYAEGGACRATVAWRIQRKVRCGNIQVEPFPSSLSPLLYL